MSDHLMEELESRTAVAPARKKAQARAIPNIFRLRIEEFIALLFVGPIVFLTVRAYLFYRSQGHVPALFISDVQRVAGVVAVITVFYLAARFYPRFSFLRDFLPFAYCLAVYTNLHDTIRFANPHDIHNLLIAADDWIFGVQLSVWAEQFIHPWLTEILSFCYWSYFILIPLMPAILYLQKRKVEFRSTMITTVLCFYAGYVLYVMFPAISPSVVLKDSYTVSLQGTPITDFTMGIAGSLPKDIRDAFPSLHAAITLLALLFAWKHVRWLFWVILPISVGLVISTIYLRHHYFIDLPAGFLLAFLAYKFSPSIDAWWQSKNPQLSRSL